MALYNANMSKILFTTDETLFQYNTDEGKSSISWKDRVYSRKMLRIGPMHGVTPSDVLNEYLECLERRKTYLLEPIMETLGNETLIIRVNMTAKGFERLMLNYDMMGRTYSLNNKEILILDKEHIIKGIEERIFKNFRAHIMSDTEAFIKKLLRD